MENYLEIIKTKLKEEGFKLTPQRRSIVETMFKLKGEHLSSEEIYDLVKKDCPEIGLATVYRTLQLLDDIGAVLKLNLDDGCCRYEINIDDESHNHHHLICKKCSKVIEVKEDLLEVLEDKIESSYGFEIYDHDLKFFGICDECK
ncbi:Fur family transcriptional regulator [Alkalithermobacter paradoxus]|uniref:Ferric uptake regulation protein n=1 Tax=Alkalithermobacter paradoxus TaxID=29349 RepID=A0A1V4IBA3_9FIRM|nr:ferric uptake regulation protein [[Clostridium] thermoalcaliphilum]